MTFALKFEKANSPPSEKQQKPVYKHTETAFNYMAWGLVL